MPFRFFTKDIGADWEVVSISGQVLKNGKVSAETTLVSVQNLAAGAYFLRVKGKKIAVGKFVIVD